MPWLCLSQNSSMSLDGDMTLEEQDQDARVNYPVYDYNDNLCALIKVTVVGRLDSPLTLDVGSTLTVAERVERQDGEVWFYIPAEVKNLEFRCRSYEPIKMSVPLRLKGGNVYRVKIISHSSSAYIRNATVTTNYLKLNVKPANAILSIGRTKEYEISSQILADGNFSMLLDYGEYYYRIRHEFYETMEGVLTVDADVSTRYIEMTPAYSYLDIRTVPDGAMVYVDGEYKGTTPLQIKDKLRSGQLEIRTQMDMYYPCDTLVHIPGDTLRHVLELRLQPQFGTVTCRCDDSEAELWLDNEFVGIGTWVGELSSTSSHYLEARKRGHVSRSIRFDVVDGESSEHTVGAPEPLYGTIEVVSTPAGASVSIDGMDIGTTPLVYNNVLTDERIVRLTKNGYKPYVDTIFLNHNEHLKLRYTLEEGSVEGRVHVSTHSDSYIFLGDSLLGKGQWDGYLPEGQYSLRSVKSGCNDGKTELTVYGDRYNTAYIPDPIVKTGELTVTSNVKEADISIRQAGSDYYAFGHTTPHTFSLIPGQYFVSVSKTKYDEVEKSVTVTDGQATSINFKLKKQMERLLFSNHFVEMTYGYGFGFGEDAVSSNYVGLNYGYVKSRVGMNMGLSYGIEHSDVSFSIGPAFRLSGRGRSLDFQIYAAPGVRYDANSASVDPVFRNTRWHLMGDVGMRFNFDDFNAYSDVAWASLSLGCRFSSNFIIPTLGVSLFPVAFAMADREYDFASNFLDFMGGYSLDEEFMLGASYSWIATHLGVYGSFLLSVDEVEDFTVSLGAVFRLTTDYSALDLQIYGGPAFIFDEFGGDMGIRFGWNSDRALSWWDFSVGCQVSDSYVIPTFSVGIGIPLVAATLGTILLM